MGMIIQFLLAPLAVTKTTYRRAHVTRMYLKSLTAGKKLHTCKGFRGALIATHFGFFVVEGQTPKKYTLV